MTGWARVSSWRLGMIGCRFTEREIGRTWNYEVGALGILIWLNSHAKQKMPDPAGC
jgi:hypothetical protein